MQLKPMILIKKAIIKLEGINNMLSLNGGSTMEQYDKVDKLVNEMLNIDLPNIPDMLNPAADKREKYLNV